MATSYPHGVPVTPQVAMVDPTSLAPTNDWYSFFVTLWSRTGGNAGSASAVLDTITNTVGALLYRSSNGWLGINPAAQYNLLQMGSSVPGWSLIDGNAFSSQSANKILAAPSMASGTPSFRTLVTSDLNSVAGQFPGTQTNDNATSGNVGEFISSSVPLGSAVSLANTIASDITTISLTAGDWDVWGNIALNNPPTTSRGWINTASKTDPSAPNGGAYANWSNQTVTPIGMMRVSLAATTTLYLSVNAGFSGSLSAYGFLGARRMR